MPIRVIATLTAILLLTAPVRADLSNDYRALLLAAADRQDDAAFLATAELVAAMSETGQADILALLAMERPDRLALLAAWQAPADAVVLADAAAISTGAVGETAPAEEAGSAGVETDFGSEARPGRLLWIPGTALPKMPDHWSGRLNFGLNLSRGETEEKDYRFSLELDREQNGGYQVDSQIVYAFSEINGAISRDDWLLEARLSRRNESDIGYYIAGTYQDDEVGSYERSAFATGGAIWQAVDDRAVRWQLRGGTGARYRAERMSTDEFWDPVVETGSDFDWQITPSAVLESDTIYYAGASSRLSQVVVLRTPIAGQWSFATSLRAAEEFNAEDGATKTETELDLSLSREF